MLFVNFLKKNAEAGQAFFKKLLLVLPIVTSKSPEIFIQM